MLKSSKVFNVIVIPSAAAASETFNSVVVPALVQTIAPSISLSAEADENPSDARAIIC